MQELFFEEAIWAKLDFQLMELAVVVVVFKDMK